MKKYNKIKRGEMEKIMLGIFILVLTVNFAIAGTSWSDEEKTTFDVSGDSLICVIADTGVSWSDGTSAIENCYRDGGIMSDGTQLSETSQNGCCPSGYVCSHNTLKCEYGRIPSSCADFKTEASCLAINTNKDGYKQIEDSIYEYLEATYNLDINERFCSGSTGGYEINLTENGEKICYILGACGCEWVENETGSNVCKNRYYGVECGEGDPEPVNEEAWKCIVERKSEINECSERGVIVIELIGKYYEIKDDGTEYPATDTAGRCPDKTLEYSCPSKSAIPFFTLANLIVSCLAVCLVYFIFRKSFR
ncbi:MAG: hypothetical protein WC533_01020 [Candidatus Pacearchaeota archaeon]